MKSDVHLIRMSRQTQHDLLCKCYILAVYISRCVLEGDRGYEERYKVGQKKTPRSDGFLLNLISTYVQRSTLTTVKCTKGKKL